MPVRVVILIAHLLTPGIVKAGEAAVLGVKLVARLTLAVTCANDIRAATTTPRLPTLSKPLTKLLGGLGTLLLLLALASASASTPTATAAATTAPAATAAATAAATPSAAAAAYATASSATASSATASTAATDATTPATSPSSTSASSTSSTTTTPGATSATLGSLALAVAAPPTQSRGSTSRISTKEVNYSNSSERGGEGRGRAPLKDGGARSATSSTDSYYALLCCKEVLL
ncbi:unnamed protein product [Closterium sp. Yama58-4]|nr:unnamed protein product [Closterium sp. Yama58-4]